MLRKILHNNKKGIYVSGVLTVTLIAAVWAVSLFYGTKFDYYNHSPAPRQSNWGLFVDEHGRDEVRVPVVSSDEIIERAARRVAIKWGGSMVFDHEGNEACVWGDGYTAVLTWGRDANRHTFDRPTCEVMTTKRLFRRGPEAEEVARYLRKEIVREMRDEYDRTRSTFPIRKEYDCFRDGLENDLQDGRD